MSVHTPEELQQIIAQIDAIDWSQYHTAYGNASGIETNPKKWWERFLPMSMTIHLTVRYWQKICWTFCAVLLLALPKFNLMHHGRFLCEKS